MDVTLRRAASGMGSTGACAQPAPIKVAATTVATARTLHILSTPALTSTGAELSTSGPHDGRSGLQGQLSDSDRNDPPDSSAEFEILLPVAKAQAA
jgi:hypothetical protein